MANDGKKGLDKARIVYQKEIISYFQETHGNISSHGKGNFFLKLLH